MHFFTGSLEGTIQGMMTNPTRIGFLKILEKMGWKLNWKLRDGHSLEETADLEFKVPELGKAFEVHADEIPQAIDEIPILAVMASYIDGESRFYGLEELRVKESDRLSATEELIQVSGGKCRVEGDTLIIDGKKRKTNAFSIHSRGDHRIAMSACCMALASPEGGSIEAISCIDVSFPNFFDVMSAFR